MPERRRCAAPDVVTIKTDAKIERFSTEVVGECMSALIVRMSALNYCCDSCWSCHDFDWSLPKPLALYPTP